MNRNGAALLILPMVMVACGGGGGSGGGASTAPSSGGTLTPSYSAVTPTVGDYSTWKSVTTVAGSAPGAPTYNTDVIAALQSDGGIVRKRFYTEFDQDDAYFDAAGRLYQIKEPVRKCTMSYAPARLTTMPQQVSLGMTWEVNSATKYECPDSRLESKITIKSSAIALESITVGIGTFKTIKVVASSTSDSSTTASKTERTCWVDYELNTEVKCTSIRESTSKSTGRVTKTTTDNELVSYASANARRRFDSMSRFAGTWSGGYGTGSAARACTMTVDAAGAFQFTCGSRGATGKIAADGSVKFWMPPILSPVDFAGNFDNPAEMNGTATFDDGWGRVNSPFIMIHN